MAKWARIKDNVIVEIIDFDPEGKFHPDIVWQEVPNNAETGMVNRDGQWVTLEKPVVKSELEQILELLKAQK